MSDLGFVTIADLADEENVELHHVTYVVRRLRIQPAAMVGNCRIFTVEAAEAIRTELRRIDHLHAERRCVGDTGDAADTTAPAVA